MSKQTNNGFLVNVGCQNGSLWKEPEFHFISHAAELQVND